MSDSFEEDFRTALLGGDVASMITDRVSWGELPQARPRPLVVLWDILASPDYTTKGKSGLESRILQIDCRGETFSQAKNLARAVRDRIEVIIGTFGETLFHRCFFQRERDMGSLTGNPVEPDSCVQVDVIVWYKTAT